MMAQVNATQFPHELIRVESFAEVAAADGLVHETSQEPTPFAFHPEDAIANWTFDVVELEESRGDGTSARQAGALGPARSQRPIGGTTARDRTGVDPQEPIDERSPNLQVS